MRELLCPFHVECSFLASAKKTPSDAMLEMLFCRTRYEDCDIAQKILANMPVPSGARPDSLIQTKLEAE
jgi:hypothetical protein